MAADGIWRIQFGRAKSAAGSSLGDNLVNERLVTRLLEKKGHFSPSRSGRSNWTSFWRNISRAGRKLRKRKKAL